MLGGALFELKDYSGIVFWLLRLWSVMSKAKAKQYRALAEECDRQAATAHDPDAKIKFRDMARHWRELEIQAALERYFHSGRPRRGPS